MTFNEDTRVKIPAIPTLTRLGYYLNNNEINQIFEILLKYDLTPSQKTKLYKIFNELCDYGFYHKVEKYIEQIKD